MKQTLRQLAEQIGAEVVGDASVKISAVAPLEEAGPDDVTFLSNRKYEKLLETTRAGAVIVAPGVSRDGLNLLRTADPYLAFSKAVVALHGHRKHPHTGAHPRAFVDPTASVGEGTVIYPQAYIGPGVKIGCDCIIYPNVVIYDGCVLGDRVIVHAGVSLGHDGYGYATSKGVHHKIPQIGNVIVEDNVEIGANCAIQRAAMGSTVIGKGTKIDSLVSIGHGTKVGEACLLVSQVGVSGSTTLGNHVTLAGQVGVAGHIKIGNNVTAGAQAGITNDVPDETALMGSPAIPIRQGRRAYVLFTQLPELAERIKQLEQQVAELSHTDKDKPR